MSKEVVFVDSPDKDREVFQLMKEAPILGVDTETSGLHFKKDCIWSVQISDGRVAALYPFNGLPLQFPFLKRLLLSDSSHKVMHNATFDLKFLKKNGYEVVNPYCSQVAEQVLEAGNVQRGSFGLKDTIERYFGIKLDKTVRKDFYAVYSKNPSEKNPLGTLNENYFGIRKEWTPELITYATDDVFYLPELYHRQMEKARNTGLEKTLWLEMKLIPETALMEYRGVRIDLEALQSFQDEVEGSAKDYENKCKEALFPAWESAYQKHYSEALQQWEEWHEKYQQVLKDNNQKEGRKLTEAAKAARESFRKLEPKKPESLTDFNLDSIDQLKFALAANGIHLENLQKDNLQDYAGEHPVIDDILHYNKFKKLSEFCLIRDKVVDGVVHPSFKQGGTESGRYACIAEGQLISVPGGLVPIEEIKVGDYVYTYNTEGKVTIKKVLNVFDNGVQECVQVNWTSSGKKRGGTGNLICTPGHLIKTKYADWVRAEDLAFGDKLYHLRRGKIGKSSDRVRLYGTNSMCQNEEWIIKTEYFKRSKKDHIHHINGVKWDNRLENLEVLSPQEHAYLHGIENHETGRLKYDHLPKYRHLVQPRRGADNPKWISKTKFQLLRMLAKSRGVQSKVSMDFECFKAKCESLGVNLTEASSRYSANGTYLSRARVEKSYFQHKGVWRFIQQDLGVGRARAMDLVDKYGICYNHMVTSVKPAGYRRVYDLEVEDTHNFIASEICVHNCSDPNGQNIPARSEEGRKLRACFKPRPGNKFVSADYAAIELVIIGVLSNDERLLTALREGKDLHVWTMSFFVDCPYDALLAVRKEKADEEQYKLVDAAREAFADVMPLPGLEGLVGADWVNTLRDYVKTLTYGIAYQLSAFGLSKKFKCSQDMAQQFINKFFGVYSSMKSFLDNQAELGFKNGYSQNINGRRRYYKIPRVPRRGTCSSTVYELALKAFYKAKSRIRRQAGNMAVQSVSADITKLAMLKIAVRLREAGFDSLEGIVLTIHDEIILEVSEQRSEQASSILKSSMQEAAIQILGDSVPIEVEPKISDYWKK